MFRTIILAISTSVLIGSAAVPAAAGGSMASEVRVVIGKTPSIIRRYDELRRIEKNRLAARKTEAKIMEMEAKSAAKRAADADKAYYKKLDKQRKDRAKKK